MSVLILGREVSLGYLNDAPQSSWWLLVMIVA